MAFQVGGMVLRGVALRAFKLGLNAAGTTYTAGRRMTPNGALLRTAEAGVPDLSIELVHEPFQKELREFIKEKLPKDASAAVLAYALKFLQLVMHKTPVDTGLARATWGAMGDLLRKARGNSTRAAVAARKALGVRQLSVSGAPNADSYVSVRTKLWPSKVETPEVVLENRLPYIWALEYGWSRQAPLGMVRLSFAELRGLQAREIARLFRASWIESLKAANRNLRAFVRRYPNGRVKVAGVRV